MSDKPMMKCGHAANAIRGDGAPVCVICVGIVPGATVIDDAPPDLSARTARCTYYGVPRGKFRDVGTCGTRAKTYGSDDETRCVCERPSGTDLAFFNHKPDKDHDEFYCGCKGWD